MKRKAIKRLCSYALALGVITSLITPIKTYADTNPAVAVTVQQTPGGVANFGRGNASITIKGNQGQTLVGKSFNVYKPFNAQNSKNGESINYTLNPTYTPALQQVVGPKLQKQADQVTEYEIIDYIQSLNTNVVEGAQTPQTLEGSYSEYRNFVEELRNKIVELNITGDVVTVNETKADNSITISGLDFGYYVTDEITAVEGTHSAASLIMVNTANPNAEVNIKSDYPTIIKKILEDDNQVGWNDIADYEIGQTVPYKFDSTISNMNGYDTYYYAWRDIMAPELTFKPDSVAIEISGQVAGVPKTYTLKTGEFTVNTKPTNGDTFNVEIQDIKAIIDREFDNKNNLQENTYDQTVQLRYDAILNDKAALKTGRPGFENDVKLVFSNDPDRTEGGTNGNPPTSTSTRGETPWDTVVCFTFRINGVKVNNHGATLEGAKFKLYSDKDLQNEVYVKEGQDGYIVINRDSAGGKDHTGGTKPQEAVEMVSNAQGVFNIIGLDQGTYYLSETQAPDGYRRLLDPIVISVVPTYQADRNTYVKGDGATDKTLTTLTAKAIVKEFWAGVLGTENLDLTTNLEEGSANITVVNKVGSKLPVTGSFATIGLLTLGSGLMGYALINKKKTKAE